MSELIDRIKNHPVFGELRTFGIAIDAALKREHTDPTAAIDGLERLRAVLTYTGKRLSAMDPAVSDPRPLASIQNAISKARVELEAYPGDGNVAHIASANSHADDVIGVLAAVITIHVSDDLTAINEAAGTYRTTLEGYIRNAQELIGKLTIEANTANAKFQELTTDVAAEKQKLAQVLTEQQTAFATAQTERQEKAAAVSADYSAQFNTRERERQIEFGSLIAEHSKKLIEQDAEFTLQREARLKVQDQAIIELKAKFEGEAAAVLAKVEAYRSEVQELVGIIGNSGVTSGYQKMANHARNAQYFWQGTTVLALAALIVVACIIAFGQPPTGAEFYQGLSTRIFLSITLGVFAAYAARQASNFWQVERHNRKLALELQAIGPFIAALPEADQHKFRLQIGERSFGTIDGSLQQQLGEKSPVSAIDLIKVKDVKELIETISKVIK